MAVTTLEEVTEEHIDNVLARSAQEGFYEDASAQMKREHFCLEGFLWLTISETRLEEKFRELVTFYAILREAGPLPPITQEKLGSIFEEMRRKGIASYMQHAIDSIGTDTPLARYIEKIAQESDEPIQLKQGMAIIYHVLQSQAESNKFAEEFPL